MVWSRSLLLLGALLAPWCAACAGGQDDPVEAAAGSAARPGALVAVADGVEGARGESVGPAGAAAGRTHPEDRVGVNAAPIDKPAAPPADGPAVGEAGAAGGVPVQAPPVPASVAGTEARAARELLHRPAGLAAWLMTEGAGLDPIRREFALALASALHGPQEVALNGLAALRGMTALQEPELALLEQLLSSAPEDEPPQLLRGAPLALAAGLARIELSAGAALQSNRWRAAARRYSRLLLEELGAPWPADPAGLARWSASLRLAQRGHRWSRGGEWPALELVVEPNDSLISVRKRALAQRPDLLVCTGQIERANEALGKVIHPGQTLRVPTDRASMLVDLDAHWCLYLWGDEVAAAYPIGVGRGETPTPPGEYRLGEKTKEPMWFPLGRRPVPFGDPENPLGTRWLGWLSPDGVKTGLGFHGTNEPASIGGDQSQGCIRLRNEDAEELYEILPRDARIRVQP